MNIKFSWYQNKIEKNLVFSRFLIQFYNIVIKS